MTPQPEVSSWTQNTDEQETIQTHLLKIGVKLETGMAVDAIGEDWAELACVYSGKEREVSMQSLVMVTSREPQNSLHTTLREELAIEAIGDCNAPGTIAHAVYAGHRYARELDAGTPSDIPFRREHALAPPRT